MQASFFDENCVWHLADALTLPHGSPIRALAHVHEGGFLLADSKTRFQAPTGPVSVAFEMEGGDPVFVMSLPSLWAAGGVTSQEIGLENLMTAVMLHEASHVFQFRSYGKRISTALAGVEGADDFTDDTIQKRYEKEEEFADAIASEQQLFLEAATASDAAEAKRKVAEALALMDQRDARFLSGDRTFMRGLSDLFWTMEGSGQWLGYHWLTSPHGGQFDNETARLGFGTRGRWWSQSHGFAMAYALSRLNPDWPHVVFGNGNATIRELLKGAMDDDN
jgi:hypothetical protein